MFHGYISETYIRSLLLVAILQNLPQHIDRSVRLNSNTSQQSLVVNVSDKSLGVSLLVSLLLGALGGTGEGGLVVEAVEVAASFLELLDPFLGLSSRCKPDVVYSHS
jgi:hypothetical protein